MSVWWQDDAAAGRMYYRMILDGREVQMMLNPFELPTTSQPPNVNVTLAQVLRDRVTGELFQAPWQLYYDGARLFLSVAE